MCKYNIAQKISCILNLFFTFFSHWQPIPVLYPIKLKNLKQYADHEGTFFVYIIYTLLMPGSLNKFSFFTYIKHNQGFQQLNTSSNC